MFQVLSTEHFFFINCKTLFFSGSFLFSCVVEDASAGSSGDGMWGVLLDVWSERKRKFVSLLFLILNREIWRRINSHCRLLPKNLTDDMYRSSLNSQKRCRVFVAKVAWRSRNKKSSRVVDEYIFFCWWDVDRFSSLCFVYFCAMHACIQSISTSQSSLKMLFLCGEFSVKKKL